MLFIAFILSLLVSISLPSFSAMDIARVRFDADAFVLDGDPTEDILGIWAVFQYLSPHNDRQCSHGGHGYILEIIQIPGDNTTFIGSSWTRGLAIHPVATVATVIALALSLSSNLAVELAASITSLVVAFLTILAFIVDIALFGHTKHEFNQLIGWRTSTGPGFWLTFVSMLLLLGASYTVCIGRRRRGKDPFADNESNGIRLAFWKR